MDELNAEMFNKDFNYKDLSGNKCPSCGARYSDEKVVD